ncbi:MAG: TonB-dependent receptor, partial [Candidatus Competibacter sp.]
FSYTGTRIEEAFKAPPGRPSNNPQPSAVNQSDVNWHYYGISLQDQYEVSNRLSVTVGLRFDHRDDLDLNLFTPRLAAVWRLSDTHILKAQYSEGYRAPTFWELFPNNTQIDLKPETVATTELSYINRVTDRVLRLTLFNSQLEDHISPLGAPSFDFDNVGSSRTAGVELEWEQQWSPQLKSWFNLSYSDSRDGRVPSRNEATNDQDPGTTDWLGNLALFYRPTDRMLLTAYWNYIGERHAESVNSTAEHRVAVTLSLFNIWTKGLTLRLGVRNLLQADQRSLISLPTNVQVTDFPDSLVWGQISYDF